MIHFSRAGISKVQASVIVVVVIVAVIGLAFTLKSPSGGGGVQSTAVSQTSATGSQASTLTYETYYTAQYLDPTVDYVEWDYGVMNNQYEYLLWYNGTSGSAIIPWLAESYTLSPDKLTVNFTLRQGINFQDGEPFNSTAAYFSIYRMFVIDGAAPTGYGYGPAWIQQQLADTSLSTVLSGHVQPYSKAWVDRVLAQNFVEVTGPNSFTMHLKQYDSAFPYLWATYGSPMIAPGFTMTHDLALWTSQGYNLPFPTLSGDALTMIKQYFYDEVATCGAGPTPGGCGYTYLDNSVQGSTAGTGPYILVSHDMSTQNIVLQANPNYWGGPYQFSGGQKIVPQIPNILIKFVPDQTSRIIDLQNAAKSGALVTTDVLNDHLYDVADRTQWLQNSTLASTIPGVTLYGAYTSFSIFTVALATNVTNRYTGVYYRFQPFADLRLRLAFGDSVNMSSVNLNVNNNLGQVMLNIIPPGLPPAGTYNPSITPRYHFDPVDVQNLLLDAMMHPITNFTFKNGTVAPPGTFDNSFGCAKLNAQNMCGNPVPQTIDLYYPTGDSFNQAVLTSIAATINNASATYNMGLLVTVVPSPIGQMISYAFSGELYAEAACNWYQDYPWALDFVGPLISPGNTWYAIQGFNYTAMGKLYQQAVAASHSGDTATLVSVSNQMVAISNNAVMSIYEIYPSYFVVMTSNVKGYFYNPSEPMTPGYYFATMYA